MSSTEIKTGRELDAETGLFYYRARYFSADLGRFLSRDPLGFSAGDSNLYRYCTNSPLLLIDPSGAAAEEKPASAASERAKQFEQLLPMWLDALKRISKETKDVERFGAILMAVDAKTQPLYKFTESVTSWQKNRETGELRGAYMSFHRWWGSKTMQGGFLPIPDADGRIDLDQKTIRIDRRYKIVYSWHTHPRDGDPWPSTDDGRMCKNHDIVGAMVRYIARLQAGKTLDDWSVWIVDVDGKAYEYKPPTKRTVESERGQ